MTGRRAGFCVGAPTPGFMQPWLRRGWGRMGWWGGGGRWRAFGPVVPGYGWRAPTDEQEALKSWADGLRKQLEAIEKRLSELEGE